MSPQPKRGSSTPRSVSAVRAATVLPPLTGIVAVTVSLLRLM